MIVARGYETGIVDAKVKLCNTFFKTANAMSEVLVTLHNCANTGRHWLLEPPVSVTTPV
jgi:hypothetical protein